MCHTTPQAFETCEKLSIFEHGVAAGNSQKIWLFTPFQGAVYTVLKYPLNQDWWDWIANSLIRKIARGKRDT